MSTPVSSTPTPTASAEIPTSTTSTSQPNPQQQPPIVVEPTEQSLRESILTHRLNLKKREPLNPTYSFLLLQNSYATKPPKIHVDGNYKKITSDIREYVEYYMNKYGSETPVNDARRWNIGRHRSNLNENQMRESFTIRECKDHEQKELITASLAVNDSRRRRGCMVDEKSRKRSVEAMALGLLEIERKKTQREKDKNLLISARAKMLDAEKKTLEMKRATTSDANEAAILEEKLRVAEQQSKDARARELEERERALAIELAKSREAEREKERIAAEKQERERIKQEREAASRRARQMETPQQALHRLYEPIFTQLWDMEFWDGLNPFRIVIDKTNCAAMGAPDYCDIIEKPMNLTYIREKVDKKDYMTLQAFFGDVELLINNALLYNSDPNNPYHVAALKMKNKYIDLRKQLMLQIEASKSS